MADVLKVAPRKARKLTGRGRLPDVKNLQKKTADELRRTLARFGIEPDMAAIEKRASRAFERLEHIIDEGIVPDEATWDAIDKQLEREMLQSLRQMTKAAIRNYKRARVARAAKRFSWMTVGDTRVCPSCEPRHGKVKSMAQWEAQGLPGSAALVCGRECRCDLIPVPA